MTVSIDRVIPSAAARLATRVPAGVVRCAAVLAATVLVTSGLSVPGAVAHPKGPRTVERDSGRAPLAVSIESLTPSTLPRRGDVTVTGEITNRSDSTWTDLNVYLFASAEPMTTSEELEEANATDETLEVGARLTAPGLYDEVDDLEPGESASYSLSVPRSELPMTQPGVYWLGVHVLGTNEEGRLDGADGRARTFIASVPPSTRRTSLSLVVPLRGAVRRTPEGRLANIGAWNRRLADDGRLSRLLDLVDSGSDVPVTWVVDPAVLEAARSVAEGNPTFDVAPTDEGPGQDASESPGSVVTESPGPADPDDGETDEPSEEVSELAAESQDAAAWLQNFGEVTAEQTVLTVPYGDVDVAALLRGDFAETYERAIELSVRLMDGLGLDATPVVAPADGLFPNLGLDKLDPGITLLLSERAVPADATKVRLRQGTEAVLTSDVARVGGPTPTPPFDALALRQRILGEAAVHGLTGADRPLVVSVPEQWDPGEDWRAASFFEGLDVPWVRQVDVPFAQAISDPVDHDGQLTYSRAVRRREIPVANILATQELDAAGTALANLLTRNDTVDEQVGGAAMLGSSTNARRHPARARLMTRRISEEVHGRLGQVYVESSALVTMSSETGNFSVTVVNGLEEPVTVGLEAETGTDELEIRSPDLVSLGPGQRASVRLAVTSTGTGVHSVRISPTTREGLPLGQSTKVKVRSSQVGLVIWLIMGTGAAVFVAAIVARILRRVRKAEPAQEDRQEEPVS